MADDLGSDLTRSSVRRVLGIAYYFPPAPGVGGRRTEKFVKFMPSFQYSMSVVTSSAFGALPNDARDHIYRSLDPAGKTKQAVLGGASDVASMSGARGTSVLRRRLIDFIRTAAIPDPEIIWFPFGLRAAFKSLRDEDWDALYSSSSPETDHLVAAVLKWRSGLPWIADFRDGWMFEPLRRARTTSRFRRGIERLLEAVVMRSADAVVTVNEVIAADFRARYPFKAAKVFTIPNGFDLEDFEALPPNAVTGKFRIVYTGRVSGSEAGRSLQGLLHALGAILQSDPDLRENLEVAFIGGLSKEEAADVDRSIARSCIVVSPWAPYDEALRLQSEASALLLITSASSKGVSTSKLYEYLASGRPILALTGTSAAAELITELRAGMVVRPDDAGAIKLAIEYMYEEWKNGRLRGASIESLRPYDRRNLTAELCRLFDRVIAGNLSDVQGASV